MDYSKRITLLPVFCYVPLRSDIADYRIGNLFRRIFFQKRGGVMACDHPKSRQVVRRGQEITLKTAVCDACDQKLAGELFDRANVIALSGENTGNEASILHIAAGIVGNWT